MLDKMLKNRMSKSPTDATKSYCFSPLKNVWQIASGALKVNRIAFVGQGLLLLLVISSTLSCMGPIAYERVFNSRTAIPGAFTVVLAECPVGKSVLGGGYQVSGSPNDLWVSQSFPQITTDLSGNTVFGWQVGVTNQSAFDLNATAWATCSK